MSVTVCVSVMNLMSLVFVEKDDLLKWHCQIKRPCLCSNKITANVVPRVPRLMKGLICKLSDFSWVWFKVIFSTHLLRANPHTPGHTWWHAHRRSARRLTQAAAEHTDWFPWKERNNTMQGLVSAILLWNSSKFPSRMKWSDAKEQKVLSHRSSWCLCLQRSSTLWANQEQRCEKLNCAFICSKVNWKHKQAWMTTYSSNPQLLLRPEAFHATLFYEAAGNVMRKKKSSFSLRIFSSCKNQCCPW